MFKLIQLPFYFLITLSGFSQLRWKNVDSLFQPLPKSVHVYYTNDSLDGKPNVAYYVEAKLKDKKLEFTSDTTYKRRFTPAQFFNKNNNPLLVVNCTFFEFVNNSNLNVVIKKRKLLSYNNPSLSGRGKDTFTYRHPFASAIGITKKRNADVAWTFTDSARQHAYAMQIAQEALKDSIKKWNIKDAIYATSILTHGKSFRSLRKWKVRTAVGGGPVLIQNGDLKITNNEELKFGGKAINDKHPRTAMGYTKNGKLIIMVIQGRSAGVAEGATLIQEAYMLKDVGCWEALNLDGGGSSCLLINGKETIKPSDPNGQRSIPAVFLIKDKRR
jgi:exopolysaccharide biosynthesis protein